MVVMSGSQPEDECSIHLRGTQVDIRKQALLIIHFHPPGYEDSGGGYGS